MTRFSLVAPFFAYACLTVAACDFDGTQGSSGSGSSPSCVSTCRQSATAGCLERGYDCADACEQQGRIGCSDELEELHTCTLDGCSNVGDSCSSELAALAACRDSAAPQGCLADCLDAQSRDCSLVGLGTCDRLCSNAVAAGCRSETEGFLTCTVDELDGGGACVAGEPPVACEAALAAVEDTCETLQD